VIVSCVATIIGSAFWIQRNLSRRQAPIQMDPYRALGEISAQETARLLGHKGQVIIIARENNGSGDPVEASELKCFRKALAKDGVQVAACETFRTPATALFARGSVPRDRFLQVLDAHPSASAFVLFAGLPPLETADLQRLKQNGTQLVVIGGFRPGDQALLEA